VRESLGFDLSHQARFANACLPGKQDHLSRTTFRSIDEQAESGEIGCAPDDNWANNWWIEYYRHA